jgi:hypothetical protein
MRVSALLLNNDHYAVKRHGRIYYTLLYWFAPVFSSYAYRKGLKKVLVSYDKEDIILNLGSGPTYLHGRKDIINKEKNIQVYHTG